MKYSIQKLETYDYYDTIKMCDAALYNSPYSRLSTQVSEATCGVVKAILHEAIPSIALGLFTDDEVLVGVLLATFEVSDPTLGKAVARELVWYIRMDHRGAHALKMLKEFETWATEDMGADLIVMSQFLGIEEERGLKVLYKRKGYTPMEVSYIKEC